jgi:hypothetical protein
MKFQRTSLGLVIAALVLGGAVYYFEFRQKPQRSEVQVAKPIFSFKESDVQAFTVRKPAQTLSFELTTVAPRQWMLRSPENTAADEGVVAFLLNLMATGKSDRTLSIPVARKSEFGLDQPAATVEVKLKNQQTHRLVLGKPNFNRNFLYALADPPGNPNQDLAVLLVPIEFQNALDRPLTEWKKQKPSPTPSPDVPNPPSSVPPTPQSSAAPSPQ